MSELLLNQIFKFMISPLDIILDLSFQPLKMLGLSTNASGAIALMVSTNMYLLPLILIVWFPNHLSLKSKLSIVAPILEIQSWAQQ